MSWVTGRPVDGSAFSSLNGDEMGAESGPILTLGSLAVDGIWASPAVLHVRAQVLFFGWFMILTWTFVNAE